MADPPRSPPDPRPMGTGVPHVVSDLDLSISSAEMREMRLILPHLDAEVGRGGAQYLSKFLIIIIYYHYFIYSKNVYIYIYL